MIGPLHMPSVDATLTEALEGAYADVQQDSSRGEVSRMAAEQQRMAQEHGRRGGQAGRGARKAHPQVGERNGQAKLDERRVRRIRALAGKGQTPSQIAAFVGVSRWTVGDVIRGRYWTHVPPEAGSGRSE